MSILGTIIVGFIVGLVARALMPGKDPVGIIITTLLGIGGALVGKFIGETLGFYQPSEHAGFLMSVLGAFILLIVYKALRQTNTV